MKGKLPERSILNHTIRVRDGIKRHLDDFPNSYLANELNQTTCFLLTLRDDCAWHYQWDELLPWRSLLMIGVDVGVINNNLSWTSMSSLITWHNEALMMSYWSRSSHRTRTRHLQLARTKLNAPLLRRRMLKRKKKSHHAMRT